MATRVMRLMEKGEVGGNHWEEVCKHLSGKLKAEAMRSGLGQLASSSGNLSALTDCADAQSTRNILKLGELGRPCHFCAGGPDSRVHRCHECPAWQPAFVHVALTASAHLVSGGNSLWFCPDLRLGFAGPDCKMTIDKEAWMRSLGLMRHSDPRLVTWRTGPAVPACDMGMDASVATKERITCLCGLWGQKDATSIETCAGADFQQATSIETCAGADFQQAAYEVMSECVRSVRKFLEHKQQKTRNVKQQPRLNVAAMRLSMAGQIPLEIIAWLRDVFGLEQQVLTSALTCNCLFPVEPTVLGTSWGDSPVSKHWKVTVDDLTGQVAKWSHRCLLVLNEPIDGALSRVWEKINATARLRQVVVVIQERPGGKRLSRKHYRHYTTNAVTCTELAIFHAGTISFGHAAGWNDYANRNGKSDNAFRASTRHSHTWTCDEDGHLVAPDAHCPGILRRHDLILVAFITGNSSLEPLIEGLYAQIHVNLR